MSQRLTPPPRVEPRAADGRPGGGIGWKTVAVFVALGALTVSVFAYLPAWVEFPEPTVAVEAPELDPEPKRALDPTPEAEAEAEHEPEPRPRAKREPESAVERDPNPVPAPRAPVDRTAEEFTQAMSEGMHALNGQDYPRASLAFERARSLRPESREASDALAQVDERLRLAAIAGHRERGGELEASEDWRRAEAEYDAALALESTLKFALEGKERTKHRAELTEGLAFHVSHPERLSDAAVLEEASNLLRLGESVASPTGSKHDAQVRELRELIDAYSTLVVAELRSDGLTEVTVYRVGRLGTFERRALELRPGRYTVIGSRDGYRDVRRELVVRPGTTPEPLVVRCEEPVR